MCSKGSTPGAHPLYPIARIILPPSEENWEDLLIASPLEASLPSSEESWDSDDSDESVIIAIQGSSREENQRSGGSSINTEVPAIANVPFVPSINNKSRQPEENCVVITQSHLRNVGQDDTHFLHGLLKMYSENMEQSQAAVVWPRKIQELQQMEILDPKKTPRCNVRGLERCPLCYAVFCESHKLNAHLETDHRPALSDEGPFLLRRRTFWLSRSGVRRIDRGRVRRHINALPANPSRADIKKAVQYILSACMVVVGGEHRSSSTDVATIKELYDGIRAVYGTSTYVTARAPDKIKEAEHSTEAKTASAASEESTM
ncbi:hypothetical protein ONE63_005089 [Megalurothrips usitatus]|uniref:C2H2-type domain-containing protein n=1 Tax=Megalurothrips usitatus TaxID=439358 RepID=A0AAV7Y0K9_9NEOP|nr:hypothetical protein ONE63_005089 [Megalurothrips usitatus]